MENDSVPPLIDVVAVEPLPGFNLRITFETGEVRRFNMASLLSKHSGVFVPLRDIATFRQAFIANGTVCWPNGADIDLELLYEKSVPEGLGETPVANRIGIARGKFAIPDELSYPRHPEWESMPDVGLEVWPRYD